MPHNTEFQVTDPVKVYHPDPHSQFYIIGRVVYIDTHEGRNQYGILYYGRHCSDLLVMHAAEDRLRKMPVENPPGCPSNSAAHANIEDRIQKEEL